MNMNLDKVSIGSAYKDPLVMPPKDGAIKDTLRTLNNSQLSTTNYSKGGGRIPKTKIALGYKNPQNQTFD